MKPVQIAKIASILLFLSSGALASLDDIPVDDIPHPGAADVTKVVNAIHNGTWDRWAHLSIRPQWKRFRNAHLKAILSPYYPVPCSRKPRVKCKGYFPPRPKEDTEIAILRKGEDSLSVRLQSIKAARHSILIQALIFTGDESGLRVAKILKQKKREGLDVRVIVDATSNLSSLQSQWMYYDLKQHGIEVEGYEALWLHWVNEIATQHPMLVNKRQHEKLWLIDSGQPWGIGILGGLNIANEYFRVGEDRWRDQDVVVRGKILEDLLETFERNYRFMKDIKASRPDIFNTDKAWENWRKWIDLTGKFKIPFIQSDDLKKQVRKIERKRVKLDFLHAKARFIQSRPRDGEKYIGHIYEEMIRAAKKEIIIENAYFLPLKPIREALIDAADRGVQVTILTNSRETNDLPIMAAISRYYYRPLLMAAYKDEVDAIFKGGMHIYEWQGKPYREGALHSKYAIFDRQAVIVGSYNLDPRSELFNSESVLVFYSPDLSDKLVTLTISDLKKSRPVTLGEALRFMKPTHPWRALELSVTSWLEYFL